MKTSCIGGAGPRPARVPPDPLLGGNTALQITYATLAFLLLGISLQAAPKPKLVVAIIVDQFRYDYLTRFDGDYHEGLRKLHDSGAFFRTQSR